MKKQRLKQAPLTFISPMDEIIISPEERLGQFFDLLLQIYKRNNKNFYENNKSRNPSNPS
jgi:hypothetical protein